MPSSARRPVTAITAICGAASHSRSVIAPSEISAVIVPVTARRPRAARTPVPIRHTSRPMIAAAVHAPGPLYRVQHKREHTPRHGAGGQQGTSTRRGRGILLSNTDFLRIVVRGGPYRTHVISVVLGSPLFPASENPAGAGSLAWLGTAAGRKWPKRRHRPTACGGPSRSPPPGRDLVRPAAAMDGSHLRARGSAR